MTDLDALGRRVDALVEALEAATGSESTENARELVGLLLDIHGEALGRIWAALDPSSRDRLISDPVVSGVFELHDLGTAGLPAHGHHEVPVELRRSP